MFFSKQQSSTDLHADVHNSGKLNASAKFRAPHYRARYPRVPLIKNSIFARNVPFSQTRSHIEKSSNRHTSLLPVYLPPFLPSLPPLPPLPSPPSLQIFPSTLDQTDMHGESDYNIMFGPDICGPGTKKVHVIFNYKGKNLLIKKDIRCKVWPP